MLRPSCRLNCSRCRVGYRPLLLLLSCAELLAGCADVAPAVQVPALLGVVEDITLGPYSLLDAEHLDPHIVDK